MITQEETISTEAVLAQRAEAQKMVDKKIADLLEQGTRLDQEHVESKEQLQQELTSLGYGVVITVAGKRRGRPVGSKNKNKS